MASTRQGFRVNEDGDLRISGISSSGGFTPNTQMKADYDTDLDLAEGVVTITASFPIKRFHVFNTSAVDILVSINGNPAAGNQIYLVGGASFTGDLAVTDVRVKALADNASYAYVLEG